MVESETVKLLTIFIAVFCVWYYLAVLRKMEIKR